MTRRGFLVGGGVAAAAAIGAGTAWALSSNSHAAPGPNSRRTTGTGGSPPRPGTLAWTFQAGQTENANPAVADGVVYFGGAGGRLYAVSAATGRKVWSLPVNPASAAPTVAGGIVCVSAAQGNFYAVRAASGTLAWEVNGIGLSAFQRNWAIVGTDVAVALGDGAVRMYSADGGLNRWIVTPAGEAGYSQAVAAAGSVVYALDALGALHALNAATGREVYRVQLPQNAQAPAAGLVVSGNTLYLGARSGPLYAIDRLTGNVNWTFQPAAGFPESAPVTAGGVVYFNDSSAALHAVSAATGKLKWTQRDGGDPATSPAVAGGSVYVARGKALRRLDAKTGKPGWTFTPGGGAAFAATPAVAGGRVFIGCSNHKLYAIHA